MVAKEWQVPTLIIAHRDELLYQAMQKLKIIYPDVDAGILKAEERDGLNHEVCIASIQTAVRHIPEHTHCGYKLHAIHLPLKEVGVFLLVNDKKRKRKFFIFWLISIYQNMIFFSKSSQQQVLSFISILT